MSLYKYKATDVNGNIVKGKAVADDGKALVLKLREKNLFCNTYQEIQNKSLVISESKFKMKTKQLAFFARQLSSMLTAGISLVRSLSILTAQEPNPKAKKCLQEIYEEVQKGKSFSEALAMQNGVFPNLFLSMVAAGEASGNLDMIMVRLSDHYAKENKTHNKIRGALVYPIILGIMTLAITIIMFTFVVPMFEEMMGDGEMPPLTQILMGISDSMTTYWYLYIGVIVGLIIGLKFALRIPKVRYKFDKLKLKLPKAGKLFSTIYTARFAHTMANLYASGLQMVECIQKSSQVLGNAYITGQFETVVENVKKGESFSSAVDKSGVFDPVFTSIILVGEESGTLDEILEKSAEFYDEESETAISKLVGMLDPIMIFFMAGVIGLVLIGIYPAMYQAMGGLAG